MKPIFKKNEGSNEIFLFSFGVWHGTTVERKRKKRKVL